MSAPLQTGSGMLSVYAGRCQPKSDFLSISGTRPVVVSRCLARVAFPPGRYECYTQASAWCGESQGAWNPLHTGLRQSHRSGRTAEGGTPYLALRLAGAAQGIAFHVLPRGNWTIRVSPVVDGCDRPFAVVELGLADENLHRTLRPRETFELPEILCQSLPGGEAHLGAPALHRYLLVWMKIDFNFRVDADDSGVELSGYTAAWYRMLDDVRAAYPEVLFEGCASGGHRADLETVEVDFAGPPPSTSGLQYLRKNWPGESNAGSWTKRIERVLEMVQHRPMSDSR